MTPRFDGLSAGWALLRRQWAERAPLRLGVVVVAALLGLNGLWWHQDRLAVREKELADLEAEIVRMRSLKAGPSWSVRAQEAESRLAALQGMAWQERTPALAQAAFQDWLGQAAAKAGLTVRELRASVAESAAPRSGEAGAAATASAAAAAGRSEARARVVVDFRPASLAAFLQEIAASPRSVMVDRLQVRSWMQPPQAELDVRIEVQAEGGGP
jgi:hypothetical protein